MLPRSCRWLSLCFLICGFVCGRLPLAAQTPLASPTTLWQQWRLLGGTWQSTHDRIQGEADAITRGFAIAEDAHYGLAQTLDSAVTPQKHVGADWSAAGVCLFQDSANYWRLALVESPDAKRRYAELLVFHGDGGAIQKALRLVTQEDNGFTWTWNQTYHLRLTAHADTMTGEILSPAGKRLWRVTYSVGEANLLPSGRPALNVQGMQAAFATSSQQLHPNDIITCRMLTETNPRTPWLSLPNSRLTLFPTLSAAHPLPDTHLPAFPLHAAYYVGERPEQFPFLWAWQPPRNAPPAPVLEGPRADFAPPHTGDWQTERSTVALEGNSLRLAVTEPPFGIASIVVTVDIDRTPLLLARVAATTGSWVIKVNAGGQKSDTNVQIETRKPGTYCYDLRRVTGWHGKKTFRLMLFGLGKGTETTFADLRFLGVGDAPPDFTLDKTEWQPHQVTQFAHTSDLRLQTETGLADENTLVQLATVEKAPRPTSLLLMGQFFGGKVAWNDQEQTLRLQGASFHAALAVGRRARWLGVYPSWADWLAGRSDPNATFGIWALALEDVREGETIPLAACFAPTRDGIETAAQRAVALATPDAIHDALHQQETAWNMRLSQIPHPLDFQLRLLPAQGVTPTRIRQTYYKAWVFLLSNLLPPQPENRFPYPQMLIGKSSLWEEGAARARGSSQWESLLSLSYLAWMLPDTAWQALLGHLSLAHSDGVIEGEGLPAQFAQTAWALYTLTGDKERLRQAYPALKRVALWKIREPRWLYYNSTRSDMKEGGYVQSALLDMVALTQIAQALALPDEVTYWNTQRAQWGAQYRRWYWASPVGPEYRYFFTATSKRQELVRVGSSHGWGLPEDLLPPASRAALVTLYLKSSSLAIPFLAEEIAGYLKYSLIMATLWQEGRRQETMQLAEAAMREITAAGEFSESYLQDHFPPTPHGVTPEVSGALQLLFATLWHNGLDVGEGMPRCLPLVYTAGVLNLHWNDKAADMLIDADSLRLELEGKGVTQLRLPAGMQSATLQDGTPVLRGPLPAEGLRLLHMP